MEFIRSNLIKDRAAATEVISKDLPTNPLSHIIITLDVYNATDEATLAEILAFINKVEVLHSDKTVLSLESEDLAALNQYLYKRHPILTQNDAADNTARGLSLIVPFGRKIFDPNECFPATSKGELTLYVNTTVPGTSCDNGQINIEAVQLIGANPTRYLKSSMKTVAAPGATGENEVELPIGNKIACVQVRMTTFPATSSHTYGVAGIKLKKNDDEYGYANARAHCLVGDGIFHQNSLPRDIAAFGDILPANVIWLDYSPDHSDNFLLETKGASRVHLVLDMGVDEATYISIFELVEV
jgi:phage FluMu protein gp41